MDGTSRHDRRYLVTSISRAMNGGITYKELIRMPLPELAELADSLNEILNKEKRALDNG